MFCSSCGRQVPEGPGFCAGCGTPVGQTAPQGMAPAPQAPMGYYPGQPQAGWVQVRPVRPRRGLIWGIVAAVVMLGLALGLGLGLGLKGGSGGLVGVWTDEYQYSTIEFRSDGTGEYDGSEMTYSTDGDLLTLRSDEFYMPIRLRYWIVGGDELHTEGLEDGDETTYYRGYGGFDETGIPDYEDDEYGF